MFKNEKGQTLLELIVVMSVSVIIIGALVFATITSLRNASFSKNQAQATKLAQEGIERVRSGRDRNQCISSLDNSVDSWNGNSSNSACTGSGSIWDYQIKGTGNNCENTTTQGKCYFKIVDTNGLLTMIGYSSASLTEGLAEGFPSASPVFRRAVILSDSPTTYKTEKIVTVIVKWDDYSGIHESKLTTILRKI